MAKWKKVSDIGTSFECLSLIKLEEHGQVTDLLAKNELIKIISLFQLGIKSEKDEENLFYLEVPTEKELLNPLSIFTNEELIAEYRRRGL